MSAAAKFIRWLCWIGWDMICFLFQGKEKAKFFPPLHCVVYSAGKLVSNAECILTHPFSFQY